MKEQTEKRGAMNNPDLLENGPLKLETVHILDYATLYFRWRKRELFFCKMEVSVTCRIESQFLNRMAKYFLIKCWISVVCLGLCCHSFVQISTFALFKKIPKHQGGKDRCSVRRSLRKKIFFREFCGVVRPAGHQKKGGKGW